MVPTILNRSSCLTHEGLTSRPSLPATAPTAAVNTTAAVGGGEMFGSSGAGNMAVPTSPRSLTSVSSTGTGRRF